MGRTRSKADAKPPPRRRAPFACLAGPAAVATAAIGIGGSSSSNFGDDGAIALDAHGLVRLVPGFLRAGEIDALVRFGHTIAELNDISERYASVELSPPLIGTSSGRGGGDAGGAGAARDDDDGGRLLLLRTIEERIANLTGIPIHDDESPLMLAVSRPWTRRYEGGALQNLHHDQNTAPGRVATVC